MKNKNELLLQTHGDLDLDIVKVHRAMDLYSSQNVQNERDEIREMIYNAIPTGETTAWECILAFKEVINFIDNRGKKDCPNCNAGSFNGKHCFDCGSEF